ncbi:hypothetical protein MTR_0781s0020 [Medicago truncatula]|uniref:Uncharacterized protein n=1 Tax=Medicago truncatula TaxID=3880 RepID=A0A072TEW4_MEDTR|nr:hypothetical protein MTR_0781s0020 [Medicago truncatula]
MPMHSGDSINLLGRFNSSYQEVESDGRGQQICKNVCMRAYIHFSLKFIDIERFPSEARLKLFVIL